MTITYRAGTYVSCSACGRLLRIGWPTRSIVCSCGQRIVSAPSTPRPAKPPTSTGK